MDTNGKKGGWSSPQYYLVWSNGESGLVLHGRHERAVAYSKVTEDAILVGLKGDNTSKPTIMVSSHLPHSCKGVPEYENRIIQLEKILDEAIRKMGVGTHIVVGADANVEFRNTGRTFGENVSDEADAKDKVYRFEALEGWMRKCNLKALNTYKTRIEGEQINKKTILFRRGEGCWTQQSINGRPTQVDMLASNRMGQCEVGERGQWETKSDHRPLLLVYPSKMVQVSFYPRQPERYGKKPNGRPSVFMREKVGKHLMGRSFSKPEEAQRNWEELVDVEVREEKCTSFSAKTRIRRDPTYKKLREEEKSTKDAQEREDKRAEIRKRKKEIREEAMEESLDKDAWWRARKKENQLERQIIYYRIRNGYMTKRSGPISVKKSMQKNGRTS